MARNSDFVCVATIDYIPQALVTLESARRYGRHGSYYLFVLDAPTDTIKQLPTILGDIISWIKLFGPDDLGPERDVFLSAFEYYTAFELSCFAKYVALAYVLRVSTAEMCVYADADILIVNDFNEAVGEIGDGVVLLTSHTLGPTTDNREHEFLLYGWVNAGFFCVRNDPSKTPKVLDWLIHRVSRRGFYAPPYGLSGDQTWVSSLPFVFPDLTRISRHPGLNVGFWNLEQRKLKRADSEIRIDGFPLLVFHFSGFNAAEPSRLSKHFQVKAMPGTPLGDLCMKYKDELDAVAPLKAKLVNLTKLPCSQAKLEERMLVGSIKNNLSLVAPSVKRGFFSRVGQRVDLLLSKVML